MQFKLIPLSQGKAAIVDAVDFDWLSQFRWHLYPNGYVARRKGIKTIYLHREIMQVNVGYDVDHINHNKLDNRRNNLRVCSHSENCCNQKINKSNSSGYKGVSFQRERNKWQAHIRIDGKSTYLGLFSDKELAALSYNAAALKHHGEFAELNVINKEVSA